MGPVQMMTQSKSRSNVQLWTSPSSNYHTDSLTFCQHLSFLGHMEDDLDTSMPYKLKTQRISRKSDIFVVRIIIGY